MTLKEKPDERTGKPRKKKERLLGMLPEVTVLPVLLSICGMNLFQYAWVRCMSCRSFVLIQKPKAKN